MPNVDYQALANKAKSDAQWTIDAIVAIGKGNSLLGIPLTIVAVLAGAVVLGGELLLLIVMFLFVTTGTFIVSQVLQVISTIRSNGAADFAQVTGQVLGEFMGIETESVNFKTGVTPADSLARAKQLGELVVTMLQDQFGTAGPQSPEAGESAAKALAGYGINFATSNVFLSWLVELSTDGKFGDFDKLGEDVAQSMGLGRLTRQALRPLVRNAITQPYDRKMRSIYRADIPAVPELVKALASGRMADTDARAYMAQHGLSDQFISELIAQHTPSLSEGEIAELVERGLLDSTSASGMLKAQGNPDSIVAWKLQVSAVKRADAFRKAYLDEALKLAQQRFIDPATFATIVAKQNGPQDEQQSYLNRLGLWLESEHTRLKQADMLYLYEHGQVTLDELTAWMTDEGYNPQDQLALTLEFVAKAGGLTTKTPAQIAQAAAHLHNEHVAYVKDEFQGAYGRAPSDAELSGWVSLLDTKSRTRGDVKTEIKLSPIAPAS
jgi:hypothetical protein